MESRQSLADMVGLIVHVHHYLPSTSKWNKIERHHRLFCYITQTWHGQPLTDRPAVEPIAATRTGLRVESLRDARSQEKGIKVTDPTLNLADVLGGAIS